ncbi:MAG: hypothetical protein FJ109_17180 [Deltaproteobacteria bacterium]|nr:hypothetical protein [Deltaproteobacteria bacterium]
MKSFTLMRWICAGFWGVVGVGMVLFFLVASTTMRVEKAGTSDADLQKMIVEGKITQEQVKEIQAKDKAEYQAKQDKFDLMVKRIIWYMIVGMLGFFAFFIMNSKPVIGGVVGILTFVGIAGWEFVNAPNDAGGLAIPFGVVNILFAALAGVVMGIGIKSGAGKWENAMME